VEEHKSGLEDWLDFQGLSIDKKLVLDTQNAPFPVPVRRNLGGIEIQETKLVKYPFFIDIRPDGMNQDSGMLSGINQLTFNWGSPIQIDKEKNDNRQVISLLQSSEDSWSSADLNIQPDFQRYGDLGFEVGQDTASYPLGVMIEGSFSSWFKDKPSPLNEEANTNSDKKDTAGQGDNDKEGSKPPVINRLIDHSPDSSRLIVLASNNFLTDVSLDLSTSVSGTQYRTPVQLVANFIDWSLEDRSLLAMRNQTRYSRTLLPLQNSQRQFIEYMNYALAVLGLAMVWGFGMLIRRRSRVHYQAILDTGRIM
jgi:ABC-2 type transport system permease protein